MVSVCKNPIDELGEADTAGICGVHRRGRKKFTWTVIASQRLVSTSIGLYEQGRVNWKTVVHIKKLRKINNP